MRAFATRRGESWQGVCGLHDVVCTPRGLGWGQEGTKLFHTMRRTRLLASESDAREMRALQLFFFDFFFVVFDFFCLSYSTGEAKPFA